MSRETEVNSKIKPSEYIGEIFARSKTCWIIILLIGILLWWGERVVEQKVEDFLTLSAEIEGEELEKFMAHLNGMDIDANVTDEDIEMYHKEGYLLIRNFHNAAGIEAMRFIMDFVNKNPSVFYKRHKTPQHRYCGFFIHPFYLIPAFRQVLRKTMDIGMSTIASKLLLSNERPVEVGSILHSAPSECFTDNQTNARGNTHSDQNQGVYSIERKRTIGDNMLVT